MHGHDEFRTDRSGIMSMVITDVRVEKQRRTRAVEVAVVLVVAVAWNAWRLSSASMWADEVSTTQHTARGFSGIVDVIRQLDAVMAPYYFGIEAFTSVFGTSDAAFRFPSVLAIGVAASAFYLLARKYVDSLGAVVAVLLVIAAPSMTRYAQEARVYAFVVAGVVLSTLLLHEAAERGSRRWWVCYSVVLASVGAGHIVGLMIIAAHVLFARSRRVPNRAFIGALAPAVIVGCTLAVIGHFQSGVIGWIPKGGYRRLQNAEKILLGGDRPTILLIVSCVGFAAWTLSRRDRRRTLGWLLVPLSAPVLLWLVGHTTHIFSARYVVWMVPFYVLAAVIVWRRLGTTITIAATAGLLILWVPQQADVRSSDGHLVAYRDVAEFLDGQVTPGDAVRASEEATRLSVERYSSRLAAGGCAESGAVTWELVRSDQIDVSKTCFPGTEPDRTFRFRGVWVGVYERAKG